MTLAVALTGASGLIGTALIAHLERAGDRCVRFVRRPAAAANEISWDPSKPVDPRTLDGIDAIVNLAGENIGAGRWTDERKKRILESRVDGTRGLARAIAERGGSIAFVSGSAVGFYGPGETPVDETSPRGTGFLADVAVAWEEAADPARKSGARVVHPRFGLVLAKHGGALERMLLPFRMGVGGKLGSGTQWMSWVVLEDVVRALDRCLRDANTEGPLNVVTPNPVTNADFTAALGKALRRPTVLPVPSFAMRAMLGKELANELLLSGQPVVPKKLRDLGFEWKEPEIGPALEHLLG
jgi:uncharacterized protein